MAALAWQLTADGSPAACDALLDAGCMPPLLSILSSGSPGPQAAAARVLVLLTAGSVRARAAGARAIRPMVELLAAEGEPALLQSAALVLCNVAVDSSARCAAICAAGGHTALLQLTGGGSLDVAGPACRALQNLSADAGCRAPPIAAGAFPALAGVLQRQLRSGAASSSDSGGEAARDATVRAVAVAVQQLCLKGAPEPSAAAAAAAAAAGVPAALVQHLRGCRSDDVATLHIANALFVLTSTHHAAVCDAVAAAGGVSVLAALVCSGGHSFDTLGFVLRAL